MSAGRELIVQYDPVTGIKTTLVEHDDTHLAVIREHMSSDELFEINRQMANEESGKSWGDGKVAASIPLNLYYEEFAPLRKAGDNKAFRRKLNDRDYRKLRTKEGWL
jgi:hypothetical protein